MASFFVKLLWEKLVVTAQSYRGRHETRTLQLHVALRSEVNAKFRHFGTCSQPTCFIKKLFINSCGPRSVSKMFWGYAVSRCTLLWLESGVFSLFSQCTWRLWVFSKILYVVLKCFTSDVSRMMLLWFVFTSASVRRTLTSRLDLVYGPDVRISDRW